MNNCIRIASREEVQSMIRVFLCNQKTITMKDLEQFTNLYQVSKTLRFELRPEGETVKNLFVQWHENFSTTIDK